MKRRHTNEFLSQFFEIKAVEIILNGAIDRYKTLKNERMVKKYIEELKELDFQMGKLLEKYSYIVEKLEEKDYMKAANKYAITELKALELTKKYLGKPMTFEQLVSWIKAEDVL